MVTPISLLKYTNTCTAYKSDIHTYNRLPNLRMRSVCGTKGYEQT